MNTKTTTLTKVRNWTLSSVSIASLMMGVSAHAQTNTNGTDNIDEIVVLGTNIRGAEVVGTATLQIAAEDLYESGKVTAGDYLRELPANFAGGVGMTDEQQSGQDTGAGTANLSSGQGVNLRGLGALSTLVLVNGRRVPASGQFGDFVDVSNIPTVAIGGIEVLLDGASALYGSDAVGGVVNFNLIKQANNPITTLKGGFATQGGGEEFLASHLQPFNWDTGNLVIAGEFYKRNNVELTDRDPYSTGSDFSALGGVNWQRHTAHFGSSANIYLGNQGGAVGSPVGATVPQGATGVLTNADLTPSADGTGYTTNVYDATDILPETERYSFYTSIEQSVSDGFKLFGDARYTKRENNYDTAYYAPLGYNLQPSSPFYIADIDPSLQNSDGSIPFSVLIDDRPTTRKSEVESLSLTGGARIDLFSDWELELAGTYAKEDQSRNRAQPKGAGFGVDTIYCALSGPVGPCAAANVTAWNPFSSAALSEAQLNEYFGSEQLSFESELTQFSAKADGTLFEGPAGGIKVAIGADFRTEGMEGYVSADTISLAGVEGPYTRTERDALSLFGEVLIPLHERFDVSVAGRYEEFDADYGSSYDDFNPKIGANLRPFDGLTLQASWGTSFHAPPMRFENDDAQPLPGGNAAFVLPASRLGPCDSNLVQFNGIIGTPGTAGQSCSFSVLINSGGAGPGILKPEQAETWTMGFDFQPESNPNLRLHANYFNIEVTDRIQRIQSGQLNGILQEFFATNGGGAFASALDVDPATVLARATAILDSDKFLGTFGPPIANSPADIQMIVNATQINIASLKESGFDFGVSYDWDWNGFDVGAYTKGTYLLNYETQSAPGLPFIDQLGKYSSFGAPVALRARSGLSLANDTWNAGLAMNYVDSYECETCFVPGAGGTPVISATPVKIDSWVTFDLNIGYDLSNLFNGVLDGTKIALNVNNLFDNDPPFLDGGTGLDDETPSAYDPNNHTIIGRTMAVTLTKVW